MRVAILGGTGPLGRGLAVRLAAAGTPVTIGSREQERAASIASELVGAWPGRGLDIDGKANEDAVELETVVVATPWDAMASTVKPLAPALKGKVVVSVANALVKVGRELHALIPPRGSMAATLQAVLPDSHIAAACHHLPADGLLALDGDLESDVLVCSDFSDATKATIGLLEPVPGLYPVDAGSLAQAAAIEAFTAVLITVNIRHKTHTTLRLGGLSRA